MELVNLAVYFIPANAAEAEIRRLQAIDVSARGWRDKISVAWLLEGDSPVVSAVPNLTELASRDFKIHDTPPRLPMGRSLANGLERLVHDLRGVRVGVALGGGAARGMSHLGVLKALEQSGIVVDMIAGTSAGAMTGIMYSAGLDPDYNANQFASDLRPSWVFRRLPQGNYWYLIYKYRRGQFDPMLRKYLHDWRLEQLAVPCLSVTVDLVSGTSVVRDRGDAVHAILESINLPVLSVPIVRNGQALIDGGLVNNIPADVLVSMGCNFVIAISVTAKLETRFCDIKPEQPTLSRNKPGIGPTILRSLLVQNHNLNAFGVQPADVVIEPDVTGVDSAEFMRAKELAAIGEAAALEQVPKIRRLLNRLDPQLFKTTADSHEPRRRDRPFPAEHQTADQTYERPLSSVSRRSCIARKHLGSGRVWMAPRFAAPYLETLTKEWGPLNRSPPPWIRGRLHPVASDRGMAQVRSRVFILTYHLRLANGYRRRSLIPITFSDVVPAISAIRATRKSREAPKGRRSLGLPGRSHRQFPRVCPEDRLRAAREAHSSVVGGRRSATAIRPTAALAITRSTNSFSAKMAGSLFPGVYASS